MPYWTCYQRIRVHRSRVKQLEREQHIVSHLACIYTVCRCRVNFTFGFSKFITKNVSYKVVCLSVSIWICIWNSSGRHPSNMRQLEKNSQPDRLSDRQISVLWSCIQIKIQAYLAQSVNQSLVRFLCLFLAIGFAFHGFSRVFFFKLTLFWVLASIPWMGKLRKWAF